jgi:NDP-sugar pyrophosphorylase family protein
VTIPAAPRKALLLAAGFGTRMRPLSYDIPKPMMPLWGKPLIGHAIDLLKSWGVTDILINTHHAPESLLHYCREQSTEGCRIQISFEPEILGTGGALKRASWFFGDNPFWMMNTDIAADLDPTPILREFRHKKAIAALWMDAARGPRTVAMQGNRILNFASPTPGSEGTYTFCGLQLLSPKIMNYLPESDFSTIVDAYRNAQKRHQQVVGIAVPNAFWADLGTPEKYLAAHRDVLNARKRRQPGKRLLPPRQLKTMQNRIPKQARTIGFAALGEDVAIAPNTTIKDCVIWDDANIRKQSQITGSIVACGATVRGQIESSTAVRTGILPHDPVLTQALETLHADSATCIALPTRGSDRTFERIQTPRLSAILVRYDDKSRPENARYASHTRFLNKHGIRVPKVLLDIPEQKATLFDDAGCTSLTDIVINCSQKRFVRLYESVLDQLLSLHSIPRKEVKRLELEPSFDAALFKWERNLFCNHFLDGHLGLQNSVIRKIDAELAALEPILIKTPVVLVHRDMQSSNVFLKNGKPFLIDFQGMRLGPAAYDVASLLCDPYVMLNTRIQERLLDYYLGRAPHADSTRASFRVAAIQRLAQALGAFGRLSALPGTNRFAQYISPACSMMLRMLDANEQPLPKLKEVLEAARPRAAARRGRRASISLTSLGMRTTVDAIS